MSERVTLDNAQPEFVPMGKLDILRDQFAMAALAGLLAEEEWVDHATIAARAYDFASAMLAERRKRQKESQ